MPTNRSTPSGRDATTFTVTCPCGERFHGDDRSAGRGVRCRACGREVVLERPVATEEAGAQPARRRRRRSRATGTVVLPARRPLLNRLADRIRAARQERVDRPPSRLGRVVLWASWGYLLGTIALAALLWGTGDDWWIGTVLLFMGRWVFLLPLALLVPAALVARRWALLPLLVAALVVLGPVMGGRTGWRQLLPAPDGAPLRVATFNVGGDNGAGRSVALVLPVLLDDWKVDVAAFQECGSELGNRAQTLSGWHAHVTPELCLVSRYPISEAHPMDRRVLARMHGDASGAGGAGFVIRYTLDTPDGPVQLTNVHLETPRKGLEQLATEGEPNVARLRTNTEIRELESRLARNWVNGGGRPMIVVGDFNTPVESRIFQRHWGDLTDAFSAMGRGFGYSKYNGWIQARIDHVLVGPRMRVARVRVGEDIGSDHRAVIAEVRR